MPDYMIWTENQPEERYQVFGGPTPQEAMRDYVAEQDDIDGVIVYARECEEGERSADGSRNFRVKDGGKCWSAQVDVEMTPVYNIGTLTEED